MMAFQISLALILVYDSLNKAFVPLLFSLLSKNDSVDKDKIVKFSYLLFLSCITFGIAAYFISPYILILVSNENYILATSFIGLLCIGQSFQGLYLVVTNYIFFMKKTYLLSIVTITSGIINVILIYLFIDKYQLLGVSMAFCISMALRFLFTWILAQYIYPMPWFHSLSLKRN